MRSIPKANLLLNSKTFLEVIVEQFKKANLDSIVVVVGKDADAVQEKNGHLNVSFLYNPDYKKGQLSSIKLAVQQYKTQCDNLIIHPVDHPLIASKTVAKIVEARSESSASIIIPTYKQKRGHPVLFGKEMFNQLLSAPLDVGARDVVWKNADVVKEIVTDDEGILLNINTPDLYKKFCQL